MDIHTQKIIREIFNRDIKKGIAEHKYPFSSIDQLMIYGNGPLILPDTRLRDLSKTEIDSLRYHSYYHELLDEYYKLHNI